MWWRRRSFSANFKFRKNFNLVREKQNQWTDRQVDSDAGRSACVWSEVVTVAPVVVVPPEDSLSYRGDSMDGDSNDEGTVTESLNGETKPDPAKLAQTAIIKQVSYCSNTSVAQGPPITTSVPPSHSLKNISLHSLIQLNSQAPSKVSKTWKLLYFFCEFLLGESASSLTSTRVL